MSEKTKSRNVWIRSLGDFGPTDWAHVWPISDRFGLVGVLFASFELRENGDLLTSCFANVELRENGNLLISVFAKIELRENSDLLTSIFASFERRERTTIC